MYIQDKVEEYADEVFDLLDKGVSLLHMPDNLVWKGTVCSSLEGLTIAWERRLALQLAACRGGQPLAFLLAKLHTSCIALQAVIYFCGLKGMMPGRRNRLRCGKTVIQ